MHIISFRMFCIKTHDKHLYSPTPQRAPLSPTHYFPIWVATVNQKVISYHTCDAMGAPSTHYSISNLLTLPVGLAFSSPF